MRLNVVASSGVIIKYRHGARGCRRMRSYRLSAAVITAGVIRLMAVIVAASGVGLCRVYHVPAIIIS